MMIIQLHTDFQLIALSGLPGRQKKTNSFLFIKIDCVIVTQIEFCVISLWSLSQFFSNHKKALLRWLLHLHSNIQLISSRGLPCGRDRPSTLFYANN